MLEKIREKLNQSNKIAIFGHEVIDGDALGSMFGLGRLLEKQGKNVSYFTPNEPSSIYDFLSLGEKLQNEFDYGEYDVLVFVDFSEYSRIGKFTAGYDEYFDDQEKIIIDHHKAGLQPINALIFRDETSISTCSLLYEITKNWWIDLYDEDIATYLYMGLSTDSGNFRYDEGDQSVRAFHAAADLLKFGARKKIIIDEIFRSKSYRSVQFMQIVLKRMQKEHFQHKMGKDIRVIYSYYEDTELQEYGIDHDEADYGLHIMQDIRNNELVLFAKKVDNFIKVSLRGRGEVDCAALSRVFGGGGHHNAAGFKIQSCGYIEKDISDIIKNMKELFKKDMGVFFKKGTINQK